MRLQKLREKEEQERIAEQKRLEEQRAEEERRIAEEKKQKELGYINGHEYVDLGLSVKWAT